MSHDKSHVSQNVAAANRLIYVVDSLRDLVELVSTVLVSGGYKVERFSNHQAALEQFLRANPRPALLLTDYLGQASFNGLQLIRRCVAADADLKVILFSGFSAFKESIAVKPDCFCFVPKNADLSHLKAVVDYLLAGVSVGTPIADEKHAPAVQQRQAAQRGSEPSERPTKAGDFSADIPPTTRPFAKVDRYCLDLVSGQTIWLESMIQYRTYSGLIEGIPNVRINRRVIRAAVEKAQNLTRSAKPVLIIPKIASLPSIAAPLWLTPEGLEKFRRGDRLDDSHIVPDRFPQHLPSVTCIARFECNHRLEDEEADFSWLGVVWFQESHPFPVDSEVEYEMRGLRWSELSEKGCY